MDTDQIHDRLVKAGEDWAELDYAASLLEETKKTVLAKLMNEATGGVSAREVESLSDPAYEEHIRSMVKARKEANRAKVKYDSAKAWCELVRTQEATRRAEMSIR